MTKIGGAGSPQPQTAPQTGPGAAGKAATAGHAAASTPQPNAAAPPPQDTYEKADSPGSWEAAGAAAGKEAVGQGARTDATGKAEKPGGKSDKPAAAKPDANPSAKGGPPSGGWEAVKKMAQVTWGAASEAIPGAIGGQVADARAVDLLEQARKGMEHTDSKVMWEKGKQLGKDVQHLAAGKGSFAEHEQFVRDVAAVHKASPLSLSHVHNQHVAMEKVLGRYGYESVHPTDQGQVLEAALHNWQQTPKHARQASHEGKPIPPEYQQNWRRGATVEMLQKSATLERGQLVTHGPAPGQPYGYAGTVGEKPDPQLVEGKARYRATQAGFDAIASMGGGRGVARGGRGGAPMTGPSSHVAPAPARGPMASPSGGVVRGGNLVTSGGTGPAGGGGATAGAGGVNGPAYGRGRPLDPTQPNAAFEPTSPGAPPPAPPPPAPPAAQPPSAGTQPTTGQAAHGASGAAAGGPPSGGPPGGGSPSQPSRPSGSTASAASASARSQTSRPTGGEGPDRVFKADPAYEKNLVTVKTAKGDVKMTMAEYDQRVENASEWIRAYGPFDFSGPPKHLYEQAAELYGLNAEWHKPFNPVWRPLQPLPPR